jgi:hypothetical protein
MATTTYGTLSASEHSANLRKAVIASTIGTTIEWYDFFIYGTADVRPGGALRSGARLGTPR